MTIFQMTDSVKALYDMLENEEIDEQTYNDTVENIGADEKVEGCIYVCKTLEAENVAYETEIKRLQSLVDKNKASINRLNNSVIDFMKATKQQKMKAGTFSLRLQDSERTVITDEEKIPPEYLVPQAPKPDKKAIKKAIKEGIKIEGVKIEVNTNIIVK